MESKGDSKACDDEKDSDDEKDAKGCKSVDDHARRAAVLRKVCEFYFDDENLERSMERFATENCGPFVGGEEEHSLEQTDIHKRFRELFEQNVEEFIEKECGVTINEFYRIVTDDMKSTEFYSGSTFAHVVNGLVTFESFHEMMVDAKRGEFVWGMPPLQDAETGELV